jgi:type VI secretion system secreted protein Hcp
MDAIILDMGPDVRGESTREGFAGKMDLLSFSHGVAMQITGDAGGPERASGRPLHQDMAVTKYLDLASPVLNQRCCEGKVFPQVEIIVGHADAGPFTEVMRYTLKNVLVSSISIGGGGGDRPVESLTLNYTEIRWKYNPQKPDGGGSTEGSWNLTTNRAG